MAVATVLMMVAGGLAILPALSNSNAKAPSNEPVKIMAGTQTIAYEISHFGESYLKNADLTAFQGNRTRTEGLNSWWTARLTGYGEYVVHNSYPFVTAYALESQYTKAIIDPGFGLTTMARMHITATNLATIGTQSGMDPIFVPILNPGSPGGGTVTIQWYSDVATAAEIDALKAVTSTYFGRVYYSAPRVALQDDGYWNLIYGHMTFDAAAAKTYLGLAGVGDLKAEFTTANAGNAIGVAWLNDWMTESGAGGIYDTEAGYEYSNDIRQIVLTLDPLSTPTLLNIRFWTISWGNDVYMMRMFDASGLNKYMESYYEDMYFNATITATSANIETSYYMQYAIEAWANPITGSASWSLQAQHIDYVGTTATPPTWVSKFNPYDPDQHPEMTSTSYLPGTVHYGQQVNYYVTPLYWPLLSGETLTFKLPTRTFYGYSPYVGTTDVLSATKVTELQGHTYSGEAVLGDCNPEMLSHYNAATKTVTFTGPTTYARDPSAINPLLNNSGVPELQIDVVQLSPFNLNLVAGWNLVSIPLVASYKASTIPGLATGDTITLWLESTQTYKTYIKGVSPPIADFTIPAHTGFWLWVASSKTITYMGVPASGLQTKTIVTPGGGPGWFILGLQSLSTTRHAADIPGMWTGTGKITVVAMFDPVAKTYKTWISAVPAINNFLLVPGQGYWCYTGSGGTISYTA